GGGGPAHVRAHRTGSRQRLWTTSPQGDRVGGRRQPRATATRAPVDPRRL
ncbi:MAG: hypothetical protein AVDCRST_MAG76-228, partial [uncultured Acidimicrobiales bacterium]